MWLKTGTFSAISVPEYRKLLFSATVFSVAQWSERLAIGWLFIYQTESVFLTGMSFAVRQIPMMLLAPFAGNCFRQNTDPPNFIFCGYSASVFRNSYGICSYAWRH